MERAFGSIHYDMDFPFPAGEFSNESSASGLNPYGHSMLSFPVDVFYAGLRVKFGDLEGVGPSFFASAKFSLTHPQRTMQDKDWFELRSTNNTTSSTSYLLFSSTDSRSRIHAWSGEFGQNVLKFQMMGRSFRLGWRLGADRYASDVYGIKGWQGNKIGGELGVDYVVFDTLPDVKVLTYRALYLSPGIFTTTHWMRSQHTDFDLRLEFSPATLALDEDYHLLRDKNSTSWAIGLDGAVGADLVWHWSPKTEIKLGSIVRYTRTWGKMNQHFFGDTPQAAEGNRQLERLGDIRNSLGRFTYAIQIATPIYLTRHPRTGTNQTREAQ